jgi:hypothetical protein
MNRGLVLIAAAGVSFGLIIATTQPRKETKTVTGLTRGVESENGPGRCGVERWAVKTMTDEDAGKVILKPKSSSVYKLVGLTAPRSPKARTKLERQTFKVQVNFIAFKREADSDIHLAVVDPKHQDASMILEFPAPYCDENSPVKLLIDAARDSFIQACGTATTSWQRRSGSAIVTGVLFFDRVHGQLGVASNGVELHPVLSFNGHCN